jgi:fucose permease
MIGPVIASPFVGQNSYWPAFLIGGGVSAVVLLLFLLQPAPEEAGAQETIPLPRGFRALGEVSLFLLLYFFYVGSETSFSNWIPTHLTLTFDPAPAARLTSLFWVALTAGRLLAVPVGAKVRPSRILAGSITLAIAAAALAHYLPLAPAAYALAGLAMGPMFPVGLAWIATRFRDNSERVSSFVVAGGGIGGVVFPPMVGAVVDVAGRSSISTSIGGLLLLAAGAIGGIFLLSRLHRSAPKD